MKKITKKAVVAKAPAVTKKATVAVKAPAAIKKQAEVKATVAKVKTDFVTIAKTKYGYYRYWVRFLMAEAGIVKYRFIKNPDSYIGVISVAKAEADKAKKVLAEYKKQNPGTVSSEKLKKSNFKYRLLAEIKKSKPALGAGFKTLMVVPQGLEPWTR